MAGHDLRQPLQVIQNVQDRLNDGLRTSAELRLLRVTHNASDRMTEQLDQLLDALRFLRRDDRRQRALGTACLRARIIIRAIYRRCWCCRGNSADAEVEAPVRRELGSSSFHALASPCLVGRASDGDRGPVLVTVEYRIHPGKRDSFLVAITDLGQQRRRDGAYAWDLFEDAAEKGRFLETVMVASWLEHLRQHQRVTNADRIIQDAIGQFDAAAQPKVTHFIAASFGRRPDVGRPMDGRRK
jgi:hypothetical protein